MSRQPKRTPPSSKKTAAKQAAVEKENQRKQTEYEEKVKKGKDHVKELNGRFADWYYVIADDVYHKIHLSQADVIKTKDPEKDKKADNAAGPANPAGFDPHSLLKGLKK